MGANFKGATEAGGLLVGAGSRRVGSVSPASICERRRFATREPRPSSEFVVAIAYRRARTHARTRPSSRSVATRFYGTSRAEPSRDETRREETRLSRSDISAVSAAVPRLIFCALSNPTVGERSAPSPSRYFLLHAHGLEYVHAARPIPPIRTATPTIAKLNGAAYDGRVKSPPLYLIGVGPPS